MIDFVTEHGWLEQEVAVRILRERFGEVFVYRQDGSLRVDKNVLAEFKRRTKGVVRWERSAWRYIPTTTP